MAVRPEVQPEEHIARSAASMLVAPVEVGAEDAEGPAEVKPQAARQRVAPVRKKTPTRMLRPGDLVCGECGEGNRPHRRFCGRCGTSLAEAEHVRVPWWKRIFRRKKVLKAGARPATRSAKGRGFLRVVRTVRRRALFGIAIAGVVLAGLTAVYPPVQTFVFSQAQAIKDTVAGWLPQPDSPIRPVSVKASTEAPDHGGGQAFDVATNTYWAATWDPDNRPKLTVRLGKNVVLSKVIITVGASAQFAKYDRPARLYFAYSNKKNEGIGLQDKPGAQEFELSAGVSVNSLTIEVLDIAPAENATELAITEIELFGVG